METSPAVPANTAPSPAIQSRFTKLDAQGHDLPDDATQHVAFRHIATGKLFHVVDCGRVLNRVGVDGDAEHVAKSARLFNRSDWQLAELHELELIRDITRFNPACDPLLAGDIKPNWHWTRSPDAEDPSGHAWRVDFSYGYSDISSRGSFSGFVVAVAPAGQ